jgi:ATP-dependent helicase/nuclease subunit B
LKTGLSATSLEAADALEQYALLWRVEGARWLRDWTMHPEGLGRETDNETVRAQLDILNELRRGATEPLAAFCAEMRDCGGIQAARALDRLLQAQGVPGRLRELRGERVAEGQTVQARELERIWDLLMTMLDDLAAALGGRPVGPARFAALFEVLLRCQTLGQIPQSLDAVTMGAADRVRLERPRAVFVLGLNEGVFPRAPVSDGLLSEADRGGLAELGLRLADSAPEQLAMERLLVYQSLCAAEENLFLTWPRRGASGGELRPSSVVAWVRRVFPRLEEGDTALQSPQQRLSGESEAFALLCESYAEGGPLREALWNYFSQQEEYAGRLAALEQTACHNPAAFALDDEAAARELFGSGRNLSATRADAFYRCAFQYFCRFGLRARTETTADFDPQFRGGAVHAVLENLLRTEGVDVLLALEPERRREKLERVMDDFERRFLAGEGLTQRARFLFRRLREAMAQVLERMLAEFRAGAFRPVAYELRIDRDSEVGAYEIPTEDGGTLFLRGQADRVDCAEVEGRRYVRVVDYKTGDKRFELCDVFDGLNLQMLVYLFALWQTKAPGFAGALPAGILYERAQDPVLGAGTRDESPAEIAAQKQKKLCADGLVLGEEAVLCAMEADGGGVYLPAGIKNGALRGKFLTLAELGRLKQKVDDLLTEMSAALQRGRIAALPYQPKDEPVCRFCDYAAVCGREPGGPVRQANAMGFAEAKETLSG